MVRGAELLSLVSMCCTEVWAPKVKGWVYCMGDGTRQGCVQCSMGRWLHQWALVLNPHSKMPCQELDGADVASGFSSVYQNQFRHPCLIFVVMGKWVGVLATGAASEDAVLLLDDVDLHTSICI